MLLKYVRNGLTEEEHLVEFSDGKTGGENIYYLRSCAKPLQASLMLDFDIPQIFKLTSEEIALTCASHAGENVHVRLAESLLTKFGLKLSDLKCGVHPPISKNSDFDLKIRGIAPNELYNNCVGKHLLFLAISKANGWDLKTYDLPEHPLQQLVKKRINELCNINKDYPVTKDGCGVPILSMPLNNIVQGYKNLFSNPKYEIIKNAFLKHPYIIGGENRLDTEIMEANKKLIAKVGAGGLCIIYNTKSEECIGVKVKDCSMEARRIAALEYLNSLGWGVFNCDNTIKTLHGDIIGKIILT